MMSDVEKLREKEEKNVTRIDGRALEQRVAQLMCVACNYDIW